MKTIELINKLRECSENKPQPKGLSNETIKKVSDYCAQHFDCPLPDSYADFLKEMNGFSYDDRNIFCCYNDDIKNNFPMYATYDLVSKNEKFIEYTDIVGYLLLGKSSLDYIAYNIKTKKFIRVDNGNVVNGVSKEFDSFEEMILDFIGNN